MGNLPNCKDPALKALKPFGDSDRNGPDIAITTTAAFHASVGPNILGASISAKECSTPRQSASPLEADLSLGE